MNKCNDMNSDAVSIVEAIEQSVVARSGLNWKRSKTRNVEELGTTIGGCKVTLERETWDLPEFTFVSHNLRTQDATGRQVDYVLGFLQPELNHRLAKIWRVLLHQTGDFDRDPRQNKKSRANSLEVGPRKLAS